MNNSHQASTLVELLDQQVQLKPNDIAFTFLLDGENDEVNITYAQLKQKACVIAKHLIAVVKPTERALLLFPSGLDYITAFFGCLYAGVVAVPAYPPKRKRADPRLTAIANDAGASVILTNSETLTDIESRLETLPAFAQLYRLATDGADFDISQSKVLNSIYDFKPANINSDTLAFLQYTSGSTGTPKGVMVSHGNVLHNEKIIKQGLGHSEDTVFMGWVPLFHDQGLIGNVLQPLYLGIRCVLMAPVSFLQKPVRWLQAISTYRATTSGGPNFAFDLCIESVKPEQINELDLSCWTVAFNGAEPIRAETLDKFCQLFSPCGFRREAFYTVYGMAESTLFSTGSTQTALPVVYEGVIENGYAVSSSDNKIVGCGKQVLDLAVKVVNPQTFALCEDKQVGEIWVKGKSVAQGYWNKPQISKDTFSAFIDDPQIAEKDSGPYLRTGDLGFYIAGELYFTGRLKDLIIIRGANYYPQDIELAAELAHESLKPSGAAAFSVDIDDGQSTQERLVIVQEVKRTFLRKITTEEVINSIKQAVFGQFDLDVYAVVLLKPGYLPKTTSGKVQRSNCRQMYLDGQLNAIAEFKQKPLIKNQIPLDNTLDAQAIKTWVINKIAELTNNQSQQIDARTSFDSFGINSVKAVGLSGELSDLLGRKLSPTLVYNYPNIDALVCYLTDSSNINSANSNDSKKAAQDIAIVGMSCRFPNANNLEQYWQLLRNGVDAISKVPQSRWNSRLTANAPWGGFINQVDLFDAEFFGIAPIEAKNMDPQQRLLLEVSWEALEHAGIAPSSINNTQTGVFVGICTHDYAKKMPAQGVGAYYGTGNGNCIAANRLSYFYNLHGPSQAIDTACSSSLVAVHNACQAIRLGECDMALVGGVNLMIEPTLTQTFSAAQMLSPDGRCKTFDASADGYVRGEGCGVIVLKPLELATQAGNNVLSIIKGSAVNQDGRSNGLTAPNGIAQQQVINKALVQANILPDQLSYIEAHGTGTNLGDPIEWNALSSVFESKQNKSLFVGSAKTNIGHLEAAAGIAGLIKVVLCQQNMAIAPHLHLSTLNPHLIDGNLTVPTQLSPWDDEQQIAGISSFGFGGTNAHVVLAKAQLEVSQLEVSQLEERPLESSKPILQRSTQILTLSAQSEQSLLALQDSYQSFIANNNQYDIADICYNANTGRDHFAYRCAIVAKDIEQLVQQLAAVKGQKLKPVSFEPTKIAFLFTGQGSQYIDMGKSLYQTQPVFKEAIDRCEKLLQAHLSISLLDVLYPAQSKVSEEDVQLIDQTSYSQVAIFALEFALAKLWLSWAVAPDVVMGHSVGEYVAACIAGVFSLEDGLKLIAARARLMETHCQTGAMVAVSLTEQQATHLIAPYGKELSIAAVNGPQRVVLSGKLELLQKVIANLTSIEDDVYYQYLPVNRAFHSPLMEPMLGEFEEVLNQITFNKPNIAICSNVSGKLLNDDTQYDICTPSYWLTHVLAPVNFNQGIATLNSHGCNVYMEIGPKPTLLSLARLCLGGIEDNKDNTNQDTLWLPSLSPTNKQAHDDWPVMLQSLGQLYCLGVNIDWSGFDKPYQRKFLALPTYPFERQRYWIDEVATTAHHGHYHGQIDNEDSPLLGRKLHLAGSDKIYFEAPISLSNPSLSYLADHKVFGLPVMPAASFIEIALQAGMQSLAKPLTTSPFCISDVDIEQALVIEQADVTNLQSVLTPNNDGFDFELLSLSVDKNNQADWVRHFNGRLTFSSLSQSAHLDIEAFKTECDLQIEVVDFYRRYKDLEIEYGPSFQGVTELFTCSDVQTSKALGYVQLPPHLDIGNSQMHPALLDASLQVVAGAIFQDSTNNHTQTTVPVGFEQLHFYASPQAAIWVSAIVNANNSGGFNYLADIKLLDETGQLLTEIVGLRLRSVTRDLFLPQVCLNNVEQSEQLQDWLYEVNWQYQANFGLAPDYLPTPISTSTSIREIAQPLAKNAYTELEFYQQLLPQMESLSAQYIIRAFEQLGFTWQIDTQFTLEQIANQFGIDNQSHYRKLLNRLLTILTELQLIEKKPQQHQLYWQVLSAPTTKQLNINDLKANYPQADAELGMLERCGEKLAEVLKGHADPLELLFPQGDLTSAGKIYQDSPASKAMNTLVQQAISSVTSKLPKNRGLRVLEIGAGTGGTTSYILPHLPKHQTQYVFTDLSSHFLNSAAEKFSDFDFVEYEILNIEQSIQSQGFEAGSFDIIVAANVLHATQDLSQSLSHVYELLRDNGVVMLFELTEAQRWLDLTFGLTEGWWRFNDIELRRDYPLLSVHQWQELLLSQGMNDCTSLSHKSIQQAVIIAQKPDNTVRQTAPWLIFADKCGVAKSLASNIEQNGGECTLVFEQDNISDYKALIAQTGQLQGIVHCWSIDSQQNEQIASANDRGVNSVLQLVQALGDLSPTTVYLVTQGAVAADCLVLGSLASQQLNLAQSPLWGMGKVIALEHPEFNCTRIDLCPRSDIDNNARLLFDEINRQNSKSCLNEDQIVLRDTHDYHSGRFVARLEPYQSQGSHSQLKIHERGTLENLHLAPIENQKPKLGEVSISVQASGLNFFDVFNALGLLPNAPDEFGLECAGYIEAIGEGVTNFAIGDEVIAVAPGCMSDKVTVNAQMLIHKPQNLTLSEAATIPVAYLTSYYCLVEIAQMKAGDKVLIHAASGGVGQAAIALALLVGAEVYATASPSKWQFVQSLGVKHVFNSRSLDFGAQIMEKTQGEGVDIVLNSLTGEGFIENSLLVLKDDGHFLEISKSGVWQEAQIANIKPNVKYALIDLVQTCQQSPALTNSMLTSLMTLFNQGKLLPLAKEEFKLSRAVEAFRHMQQAKHIGKIVLTNDRLNTKPNHEWQSAIELKDDASYLITGGAGGLGLLVADWLVKQGAKHLVLVGRSEATTELDSNIEKLQQAGAKVMFVQADVANYQQLESVLNTIESNFPPLKGVIHSAGVLADGVLSEQNWQRFETVFAPKVQGAWHLHRLTADMNLDFFTLFSSAAALFGSIGQANHSAANSYLDMLAHYRRAQGLAAMSINWGAWSEIGAAAARDADVAMGKKGAGSIAPRQGIQILAQLFAAPTTQVGVVPLDPTQLPDMAFYANLAANESDLGNQITDNSSDFMSQLAALDSLKEKREHLVNNVQQQVAKVLGFSQSDTVDVHKGFFDLGMDSLTAVELKNRLQSALGCTLSSTLLFKYSTVTELCKYLSDEVFQLTDEPTLDDMPNTDITDTQDLAQDLTQDHEQTISEEIGQLSEQDLEALIDSSLDFLDEKDL